MWGTGGAQCREIFALGFVQGQSWHWCDRDRKHLLLFAASASLLPWVWDLRMSLENTASGSQRQILRSKETMAVFKMGNLAGGWCPLTCYHQAPLKPLWQWPLNKSKSFIGRCFVYKCVQVSHSWGPRFTPEAEEMGPDQWKLEGTKVILTSKEARIRRIRVVWWS